MNMIFPVITLIGQKNVGKSTLFNRLTRTKDALIANYPGLTRDLQYGYLQCKFFQSIVVDTGGIDYFPSNMEIQEKIYSQIVLAMKESDIILFIIDGHSGKTSIDYDIVSFLRKSERNIFLVINKVDFFIKKNKFSSLQQEYYNFGIKDTFCISAMHGYGISYLLRRISVHIEQKFFFNNCKNNILTINKDVISTKYRLKSIMSASFDKKNCIILAVAGRPNSGKSTFINNVLGINRMITCDTPGTTRDSIYTFTVCNEQQYILIDTAGIQKQKKNNTTDIVEEIAIQKTFQAIKNAHIVLFMIDVNLDISSNDLFSLKYIMTVGTSLIIVINKWDNISLRKRHVMQEMICEKLDFLKFIKVHFISALYKDGIENVFQSVKEIFKNLINLRNISTSKLIDIMHMAVTKRSPPLLHGNKKIRLKYINVGGHSPFLIIIHGSHVSKLSNDYRQYLKNFFCQILNIQGVTLQIQFKDSINYFYKKF